MSYGATGGRASVAATDATTTLALAKPRVLALVEIRAAVRRSCSTSVTTPAPRDQASRPTAPEPAYRSRNRRPCSDPHHDSMAENSASRTRSLLGRVLLPRGASIRRPPAVPPMILVMEAVSYAFSMKSDCRDCSNSATARASAGRLRELGIALEEGGRGLARGHDGVLVAQHAEHGQARPEARLRGAQHVALAPLVEVEPAQLEAVGGRPRPRRGVRAPGSRPRRG